MLPAASFFALKTHLEPMMLAPGGASSNLHVPAAFKVASSSSIAFSHNGQSGLRLASASDRGSKASASAVSATSAYLRPSKSSSSVGEPFSTDQTPPASSGSSSRAPGSCKARAVLVSVEPKPACKSRTTREGLRVRDDLRSVVGCSTSALGCTDVGGVLGGDSLGGLGAAWSAGCSLSPTRFGMTKSSSSSPSSCADEPK
jgi:hypothetical protein